MNKKIGTFHVHTVYSDGVNTAEEMVLAAIRQGLPAIGISDHGPAGYDSVGIDPAAIPRYIAEINALKEKYRGQIEIYAGLEYDAFTPFDRTGLDYVIGSAHYVDCPETGERFCIDYREESIRQAIQVVGHGSVEDMLARYWDVLIEMTAREKPEFVAHIDLPIKTNGGGKFFDETARWYRRQEEETAQRLSMLDALVEVNTGAIFRGYRSEPYPSRHFLELFYELGVPLILSSDAHETSALVFGFEDVIKTLRSIGYRHVKTISDGMLVDAEL